MNRRISSFFCAVAAVGTLIASSAPASAAAPLPRFLPNAESGYVLMDALDDVIPNSSNYIGAFASNDKTKSVSIDAQSAQSSSIAETIKESAGKDKVHGKPAMVRTSGSLTSIIWLEKGNLYQLEARGLSKKPALAFAQNVKPTGKPDSSFTVKKVPAGFTKIYVGPQSGLIAGAYAAAFVEKEAPKKTIATFYALNVDPRYMDVLLSQQESYAPTTIRGKSGFEISADGEVVDVWMEQPNLLMIAATDQPSKLASFVESLVPVDEPTWAAAYDASQSANPSGGSSDVVGPPVAAGMLAGIPWGASVNGQCLVFTAAATKTNVCVTGIMSPSFVGWKSVVVNGKTLVFGITGANVTTVVAAANGAEVTRVPTEPVADQPGLRYFAIELSGDPAATTFSGLDAAGVVVGPAIGSQK